MVTDSCVVVVATAVDVHSSISRVHYSTYYLLLSYSSKYDNKINRSESFRCSQERRHYTINGIHGAWYKRAHALGGARQRPGVDTWATQRCKQVIMGYKPASNAGVVDWRAVLPTPRCTLTHGGDKYQGCTLLVPVLARFSDFHVVIGFLEVLEFGFCLRTPCSWYVVPRAFKLHTQNPDEQFFGRQARRYTLGH